MNGMDMCSTCMARHFDPKKGIVCGTTGEKYTCEGYCQNYQEDEEKISIDAEAHSRWEFLDKPVWPRILLVLILLRVVVRLVARLALM